ncbi:MAG: iron-containing redox enzyme family protein [Gammaproteobacteria bacterium]|nr:iron-containing redox enzyme family protein [Gammaproteobacteria bacterium]MYJ74386.1 iron-containing redox enzyme family protein [Gammaproteobacteria bacterium]
MNAPRAPEVTARADEVLHHVRIDRNPYLKALVDASMSLEAFRTTQEQFFFAVTFFPRPMAALVGRLPDPRQRLDILRNVVEEHGDFDEAAFHHTTFQEFLRRIGSEVDTLDEVDLSPAVRAFNSILTTACVLDELEVGVACMGIIERAFAGVSATIGRAVVERGWLRRDRLIHYSLHAEIDVRHADEFFAVVEPAWQDEGRRYLIDQGLQLGAYALDRLYRDLHLQGVAENE